MVAVRTLYAGAVLAFALMLAQVLDSASARAELVIDITRGTVQPLPVAIPELFGNDPREAQMGRDIAQVVSADLERSGLFAPIDPKAYIQTSSSMQTEIRYADWKQINAQALVGGKVEFLPSGEIRVEARLFDVYAEQQMQGEAFKGSSAAWRRIAHKISDMIYKRMTGEDGYFDTQIVYVAESGPKTKRVKRLAIMDQDGENHRFLTTGADLVLTPRFSPTARELAYMSYFQNTPRVYIYQLDSNRRELLGDFPGMTFAPRFSPDGTKVVMSLAVSGVTNIYEINLLTRAKRRLTDSSFIDTSPSYAPDGSRIAFNSDRGGAQQLYVMNADGSNVSRISFGDGRYATPVWSPRGDLIAFTKFKGGEFFIGVMHPDGSGERLLAKGWLVEGPTWAPNGRVLAFWRETPSDERGHGHSSRLYSIDLTGNNERQLVTPVDGSDPAWSPSVP
jgi:TolB protein